MEYKKLAKIFAKTLYQYCEERLLFIITGEPVKERERSPYTFSKVWGRSNLVVVARALFRSLPRPVRGLAGSLARNDKRGGVFGRTLNFVKYHNAFTFILVISIVATGSVMASEPGREMLAEVVGEEIITEIGIDNTALLQANLNTFDLAMTIDAVSEDSKNYYVNFSFNTLGIVGNVWQAIFREETIKVSKLGLGDKDLGLYLTEELGELADSAIAFLHEAQAREIEKGETEIIETTEYTGLIGIVLDVKNKVLPDYEPVIPEPKSEICDGLDNDLDGEIDEDLAIYSGSNTGQCQHAIMNCINGEMIQIQAEIGPSDEVCRDRVDNNCNGEIDENCCEPSTEICNNIDDDCDGLIDEDLGQIVCGIGACEVVINRCQNGYLETCIPIAPISEICDGLDNDCDGEVDEGNICDVPSDLPAEPDPDPDPPADPDPVCDADHIDLCNTQELCEAINLFWYADICNLEAETPAEPDPESDPVCDLEHIDLCDTQELCEAISLFWYADTCNLEAETPVEGDEPPETPPSGADNPVCDANNLDLCNTQELCEGINLYWYNDVCNAEAQVILGCMDSTALNYNPEATQDDGTCEYPPEPVLGCIDSTALNYNPEATQDDGTCEYPPLTCESFTYSNWEECQESGTQTRTVLTSLPDGCVDGSPILSQPCEYIPSPPPEE